MTERRSMAPQLSPRRRRRWLIALGMAGLWLAQAMAPLALAAEPGAPSGSGADWDVVVYGATPAGIAAAIAAAREDMRVVLLEPTRHIGGMTASGLGASDVGIKDSIGGLALDFFHRLGVTYGLARYGQTTSWNVTPGVAERTFAAMLADADVSVVVDARLRERDGVERVDQRITRIATVDGREFGGRVFIDATYEGDLIAQAGISFTVGREASSRYGESLAGVRPPQQELPVMPATTAGGSLAPGVDAGPLGAVGSADRHVQPYNFRLCVTTERANQVPFPRPDGYDPSRYLLVQRHLQALEDAGRTPVLANVVTINPIPDQKADLNAAGPLSTDLLGGSDEYPTASYAQREAIWGEHYRYQAGLLYFLTHDASVPDSISGALDAWGLCRDEFTDSDNWPPQLYVREARRMVSDVVLTQADLTDRRTKADAVGLGSYRFDAHPIRLLAGQDSTLFYEGLISEPIGGRYDIPYGILVPRRSEIRNLLDPVTVSASHVAFASIRMEPQYMIMGEAAGSAAALAIRFDVDVQDVDIATLQSVLRGNGVVFRSPASPSPASPAPSASRAAGPTVQSQVATSSGPAPAPRPLASPSGAVRAVWLIAVLGAGLAIALFVARRAFRRRPPAP